MIQVLQSLSNGKVESKEVPRPKCTRGALIVANKTSVISAGTEGMLIGFGRASYIEKARQHPDKVRQVLDKIKTDGLLSTVESVRSKLDQPMLLGYSSAGIVMEVGDDVAGFAPGDAVATNGPHSEFVSVPKNLCVKLPQGLSFDKAAFASIGAIAMQGIRLAGSALGECFVVTGLGLLGLILIQLLKANGCRVLGIDLVPSRIEIARRLGAEVCDLSKGQAPVSTALDFSRGIGVDGVLLAAATKSSALINDAARMCRVRGRVVQVGVTGLDLDREAFFRKEITLQISNSMGPGKNDPMYEEKGLDYPIGFVRWTEKRNMEAFIDMLAQEKVDIEPLISHRFSIEEATQAYELLAGKKPYLGILLTYGKGDIDNGAKMREHDRIQLKQGADSTALPDGIPCAGFIGAGNYAGRTLIPAFKKAGAIMYSLASLGGVSGVRLGKKFGFLETTTNADNLFENEQINSIVIATRHDSHAGLVLTALRAGKNVFVEKPLCLNLDELSEIEGIYSGISSESRSPIIMVGFNRRFAPQVQKIKELLAGVKQPKSFIMTVNAGPIPSDHWTQDPALGGGRIIGEACHFIDLLRFLAGGPIVEYRAAYLQQNGPRDSAIFTLAFLDGSIGSIHYLANGHKSLPKERLEVFCGGRTLRLDNFRKLKGYGWPGFRKMNLWRQDKGQGACTAAFLQAVREGKPSPIPFEELIEVSRITIELASTA
jgi:predicted dehydrogenase/threonine dehydrogenase-like Zn-dependent dehydrogenase